MEMRRKLNGWDRAGSSTSAKQKLRDCIRDSIHLGTQSLLEDVDFIFIYLHSRLVSKVLRFPGS